jgi:hypothetical protein
MEYGAFFFLHKYALMLTIAMLHHMAALSHSKTTS